MKFDLQRIQANPVFQKLRTFEQKRIARVSTKHTQRKENIMKTLEQIDDSIKTNVKENLQAQAQDIQEFTSIISEIFDDVDTNDNDQ
jgi:hypothetical protein